MSLGSQKWEERTETKPEELGKNNQQVMFIDPFVQGRVRKAAKED